MARHRHDWDNLLTSWKLLAADGKDEGCSARGHRTAQESVTSPTAQLPIQAVLCSAHACPLYRTAATSAPTGAWNPAELNLTRLPNYRKPGSCRRCHQTASNSIAPSIRRRRSRKHAQGGVRHLFDWSRRTGGSYVQAPPCSRPLLWPWQSPDTRWTIVAMLMERGVRGQLWTGNWRTPRKGDRKVEDHSRRRGWGTRWPVVQETKGKSARHQTGATVSRTARNKSRARWAA